MSEPMDVISISRAAEELRCSRATLYRAIDRGEINHLDTGSAKVIVADETWEAYEPNRTGARAAMLNEEEKNALSILDIRDALDHAHQRHFNHSFDHWAYDEGEKEDFERVKAHKNAVKAGYDEACRRLMDMQPYACAIGHAYNPRNRGSNSGGDHINPDEPIQIGRLKREKGDALCKPSRKFWGLHHDWGGHSDVPDCRTCLERAERYAEGNVAAMLRAVLDEHPALAEELADMGRIGTGELDEAQEVA